MANSSRVGRREELVAVMHIRPYLSDLVFF